MKLVFLVAASIALAGCLPSLESMESSPVEVDTPSGKVVCQLYTENHVWLDRSISHPPTMHYKAADQVCRDEGERRAAG